MVTRSHSRSFLSLNTSGSRALLNRSISPLGHVKPVEGVFKRDLNVINNEAKEQGKERDFLLSQNAVLRVGLTACSNELVILKKGNEAVHRACLIMAD